MKRACPFCGDEWAVRADGPPRWAYVEHLEGHAEEGDDGG